MARYKKKRARELQHDAFRDKTMGVVDRLGEKLEGKGKTILYVLCAIVAIALIFWVWSWRSNRKAQEAYRALGRAIEVNSASVGSSPAPGGTGPTYATDKDRAENAIREFQAVSAKYSNPYRDKANYFIAANKLSIPDKRNEGISELETLGRSGDEEIATLSKFALAQAKEEDGQYDAAATIYNDVAQKNSALLASDTVNLRLANVLEKQGKNKEAVEVLFKIVESARKAKDPDGKPLAQSSAARDAATKLEKLDSARYAQLPAEEPSMDLPM